MSTRTTLVSQGWLHLVTFDYTSDVLREINALFRKSGKAVILLIVREILDEEIARKLA